MWRFARKHKNEIKGDGLKCEVIMRENQQWYMNVDLNFSYIIVTLTKLIDAKLLINLIHSSHNK